MDRRQLEAEDERHWRGLTKPMPALQARLPHMEAFTEEEGARLLRNVLPQQMEDKWIVLVDGGFTLNFYRSWTGFHIYSVVIVQPNPEEGDFHFWTADAVVNRDPEQYAAGDDALEGARLSWLIRTLLLHQDVPMPQDPSVTGDAALLADWSFGGSAGFPTPEHDQGPE